MQSQKTYLGVWSVAALGIGSMVGAGIFALLGQAAVVAGKDVYLSFIIGGIVALLSGFTYARLGSRFPTSGGITDYFDKGFGNKGISGAFSLLYLITLAITLAMVGKTFGAYATKLFFPAYEHNPFIIGGFTSFIILFLGFLNMMNADLIGRAEVGLVLFKLTILAVLAVAGFAGAHQVAPSVNLSQVNFPILWGSVGLTFFAYAGYGMMANTAGNLRNPAKTLPRAIFLAIGLVIVLYVLLAFVLLDNVSPEKLAQNADTAIAVAAYPVLGSWGVLAVLIAALVATSSAINATFFSSLRIMSELSNKGQLGAIFSRVFWRKGSKGFFWFVVGIMVVANVLNLTSIANIASATFLISYLAVFVAHWRLRKETQTHGFWIVLGFLLMLSVLIVFLGHVFQLQPEAVGLIVVFVGASFGLEYVVLRHLRKVALAAAPEVTSEVVRPEASSPLPSSSPASSPSVPEKGE